MEYTPESIRNKGMERKKASKKLLNSIQKNPPAKLDYLMQELHEEAFERIDCLSCANCCKTTSPIFRDRDIDRIAKHLKMRPSELIEKHLRLDQDGDYVLQSSPCTFLLPDNRCSIYDVRPQACSTYPHTDRKKFYQLTALTYQNSFICPAVQQILEQLEKRI